MKERVERFLLEQGLLSGAGIVVGLSGGADSVCLLYVLKELSEKHGFPLYALHVHHGLRGETADRDAAFCQELCKSLGVPLRTERVDVASLAVANAIGTEEAGRLVRYRLFEEEATRTGAGAVALAHHKDDNAETVLFRICRGTGIRGLAGIPAVSKPFDNKDVVLVRPLVAFSREEIVAELESRMEKQFKAQFTLMNGNFQRTFVKLFGGGKAELRLSDPDDALNCGIDIVAQPPGKKLQMLSLLSGGERALTAIAILFAILDLKPTPFCILDEIEAALDDANIDTYADYLKAYSENTQFIVITHRKGTMERCDALYGVVMEEKGVSKTVSVKLNEAV